MCGASSAGQHFKRRSTPHANWHSQVVQRREGVRLHHPDDGGRDLFVHHSSITADGYRSLSEGSKVSYEEEAAPKGPKAVNVNKI